MITITIDWWAGTWKWTTAKWVAKALWYQYIDTWAMYRWVALAIIERGISPENEHDVTKVAESLFFRYTYNQSTDVFDVIINDQNREADIRTPQVSAIVHIIAQYSGVRKHLVAQQQRLWKQWWVVFDWRDGWTVIAPHAQLKVHLLCDLEVRARRRQRDYELQWKNIALDDIKKNLYERDQKDLYGPDATNSIAKDAIDIDTTNLTIDQQIEKIVQISKKLLISF